MITKIDSVGLIALIAENYQDELFLKDFVKNRIISAIYTADFTEKDFKAGKVSRNFLLACVDISLSNLLLYSEVDPESWCGLTKSIVTISEDFLKKEDNLDYSTYFSGIDAIDHWGVDESLERLKGIRISSTISITSDLKCAKIS